MVPSTTAQRQEDSSPTEHIVHRLACGVYLWRIDVKEMEILVH
jgi:hypothetical protein